VAQRLEAHNIPFQLLNGVQDAEEAAIVAQAGAVGAITIATNMAGRGTDIKLAGAAARLGGLHVIATEANESPRIDRQLVGRCARQGDPGSCQLFVSAGDRLLVDHAPALVSRMVRLANDRGEIEEDLAADLIRAQGKVERKNYIRRSRLSAHETWLDGVLSTLAKDS
jgi:preprotein translocase subunit SecA